MRKCAGNQSRRRGICNRVWCDQLRVVEDIEKFRKFIVADTPGHAQYTRSYDYRRIITDLAAFLSTRVRASSMQSGRHLYIASPLGIRHIVIAANKMDLVDFSEAGYRRI